MKIKKKPAVGCVVLALVSSMFISVGAMAAPANTGIENTKWEYTAVADVMTQVNIRAYASTESQIIGYLPKAASAAIVERGSEWSHIISNGVEGYIKNEYLAFGANAQALASVYGTVGVEIAWDNVNLFSAADGSSSVVGQAQRGQEYTLISDEGLWYSIKTNNGNIVYVPAEDVYKTIILDKAISLMTMAVSETSTPSVQTTEAVAPETAYVPETAPAQETAPAPAETAVAPETAAATEETVTTASSSDLNLLAALIYCEAGNQSREGKVAVGAVVMNRIASGSFPSTVSDVIYQSGQFHPAITGWLGQVLASGAPSNCYEAAQAALNGENPVPGALYFNTSAGRGSKIGDHWFY